MEQGIPGGRSIDGAPPPIGERMFTALSDAAVGTVRWVRLGEARRTEAVLALWDAEVADELSRGIVVVQGGRAERAFASHLAGTLGMSRNAAVALLHTAIAVRGLPQTDRAFRAGEFGWQSVEAVVRHVSALNGTAREEYDARAATIAAETVPQLLDPELARLHDALDHDAATSNAAAAFRDRRVRARPGVAGEASITFSGPETDIAAWYEKLRRSAVASHATDEQHRAVGTLMYDIGLDVGLWGLEHPPVEIAHDSTGALMPADPFERLGDPRVPNRKVIQAEILVMVPAETACGASNRPGRVAGWGSLAAAEVRRLVASARFWTRVETDPVDDAIIGFDSAERAIPKALRRLIHLRAERCEEPGCPTGAHLCDLDHAIRVEHGGRTTEINLTALCRPAHQTKDDGYVDVERVDGDLHWNTSRWGGHFVTRSRTRIRRRPAPTDEGGTSPKPGACTRRSG